MGKNEGMPQGLKDIMMWVLGIGIIALIILIMVILFGNLQGNLGFGRITETFAQHNITLSDTLQNATDLTTRINPTLSGLTVTNATGSSLAIPSKNYTVSGGQIKINVSGPYNDTAGTSVNITGTLNYDSQGKVDSDNVIVNYTKSATNTSEQFPVVGTIIGVAILLLILLAVLVFAIRKMMGITGGTSGNGLSGSSSSTQFGGGSDAGIA